jgi:hypothetical protein
MPTGMLQRITQSLVHSVVRICPLPPTGLCHLRHSFCMHVIMDDKGAVIEVCAVVALLTVI